MVRIYVAHLNISLLLFLVLRGTYFVISSVAIPKWYQKNYFIDSWIICICNIRLIDSTLSYWMFLYRLSKNWFLHPVYCLSERIFLLEQFINGVLPIIRWTFGIFKLFYSAALKHYMLSFLSSFIPCFTNSSHSYFQFYLFKVHFELCTEILSRDQIWLELSEFLLQQYKPIVNDSKRLAF